MNSTYLTSSHTFCYTGSLISEYIAYFALYIPISIWIVVSFIGFYVSEIVILWISVTYYPQLFIHLFLWNLFGRDAKPHPECNSGKGMPALEPMLTLFFVTFVVFYHNANKRAFAWTMKLGLVFISLFVPFGLAETGNYTYAQAFVGAGIGSLLGAVWFLGMHYYWAPYFATLVSIWPLSWMGYQNMLYGKGLENCRCGTANCRHVFHMSIKRDR